MNHDSQPRIRDGLFRYLYNHYLVRYPQMNPYALNVREGVEEFDRIDEQTLFSYLQVQAWAVGDIRPDLAVAVREHWNELSPLVRGEYLAGSSECLFREGGKTKKDLEFLVFQIKGASEVELSPESACQIGCSLLALGEDEAFANLLESGADFEQEVERASESDAKRWRTIRLLSPRVIDILLEATLVLNRPDSTRTALKHGANPNILVWQLERSYNALYSALSYAIHNQQQAATNALIKSRANVRGSESAPLRSPLAEAFQLGDGQLIEVLLKKGASFDDGARYREPPITYGRGWPVDWVHEHLSGLMDFLPLDAKPLFHSPHAQGGYHYTLLSTISRSADKLRVFADYGFELRLTAHEAAYLIDSNCHESFCFILDQTAPDSRDVVLERVGSKWRKFGH